MLFIYRESYNTPSIELIMSLSTVTARLSSMPHFDGATDELNNMSLMLKLLVAIVGAAFAVALLHLTCIVSVTYHTQPDDVYTMYSWHDVKQDLRCILSCSFGAVACCVLSNMSDNSDEESIDDADDGCDCKFMVQLLPHFI